MSEEYPQIFSSSLADPDQEPSIMPMAESSRRAEDSYQDRKNILSCAECRRSKLKCNRVFPCQSCIRRGCPSICPNGTLAATKGNQVLAGHVQRLSEQVRTLTARIKELELALAESRASEVCEAAMQQPDANEPFDGSELETVYDTGLPDVSEAIGSLSIGLDGTAKYHGQTAGSEYFQELLASPNDEGQWRVRCPKYLGLPPEIVELVNSFPFGLRECPYPKTHFLPFVPSRERAIQLVDLYYENVAWMYNPIVRHDFMTTIMGPIYGKTSITSLDSLHSHRLSVFFIVLACGTLFDDDPSTALFAEHYHSLARGALALDSMIYDTTCATAQALFLMVVFLYNSDRTSNEMRWLLNGLCTRVAHMIGLQRDSAGWNIDKEETQRRRILFWELYTHDSWTCIVNGRPPAMSIHHTDCRFPDDLEPVQRAGGETELGWHAWKSRYSASCLSISVQLVFNVKVPVYSSVLDLDAKIRKFPTPNHLQSPIHTPEDGRAWSSNPVKALQQYCLLCEKESNLLYIHRSFFAQAIRERSQNPMKHKYGPSVLATYRSACRLIQSLKAVYAIHPQHFEHFWFFWSGVFSSCIVLGALVIESPACLLAEAAFGELGLAVPFYDEGSARCRPPATLTILQKLHHRARSALVACIQGTQHSPPPPLPPATARAVQHAQPVDELEVLGGRTSVISRSPSISPPQAASSEQPRIGVNAPVLPLASVADLGLPAVALAPPPPPPPSRAGWFGFQFPFDGQGAGADVAGAEALAHPSLMDYYDAVASPGQDYDMHAATPALQAPSNSASGPGAVYAPPTGLLGSSAFAIPDPAGFGFVGDVPQQTPFDAFYPQQPLNAFGFVTQEEIWREFVSALGISTT